ncbi:hypothetical protein BS78_09G006900 [Paspalum vaginatum]|uniref:Exonuclease domain-containing protein n=1 Tax=Paspalum vaginatum TaxID=158149 RepID=A0A9W7XB98_9POAL|nr:hypothetical protein BS78_K283100 [Paspalum vaginatum]KAJ1261162.1 hypothetical protein BS78_09G006900 [Paspalum vaginatum]
MTMMTRREIVFFDVETCSSAGRWWLLEFGAILVCPRKLVEVGSYDTLIRPPPGGDVVNRRFTADHVEAAPAFQDVADKIYDLLHGRVWAGHNIRRFDCPRIREAFADIGRAAPEPAGVIDSLNVLAADFGRRAGDLKMATLANYFGIGTQKHRSLDDARMNLEVLKHCATVLLLESSMPPHVLAAQQSAPPSSSYAAAAHHDDAVVVTRRRAAAVAAHHQAAATAATTATTTTATKHAVVQHHHHHRSTSQQTKLPFTPASSAATAGGKRDSLGKLVVRAPGANNNKQQQRQAPAAALATSSRRAAVTTTTTPFHMILRHSRTILR